MGAVDTEGSFSDWGPDPAAHADKLTTAFPSGASLYYYAGTDTAQPDRYNTTLNSDLYLPYVSAVTQGTKADCDKVTSANFTEAAQERNIEAGVLVHDAGFARALRSQFEALVSAGDLRRVPGLG